MILIQAGDGGGRIALWGDGISLINSSAYADNNGSTDATSAKGINIRSRSLSLNHSTMTSDAYYGASGRAGDVTVEANGGLEILNGGIISNSAYDRGDAGNIKVTAGTLTINRNNNKYTTGITADAEDGSGNAGHLAVRADTINLLNGGVIRSSTVTTGDAGSVKVKANMVNIDGQGSSNATSISTNSENTVGGGGGNAGRLTVEAGTLLIRRGGEISSSTTTKGNAGSISITAEAMKIDNQGNSFGGSGVFSQAEPGSSGRGNDVTIRAGTLEILNDKAQISSNTFSVGNAGDIFITADTLNIDGFRGLRAGIESRANDGSTGNAGSVNVQTGALKILNGGHISSSTSGIGSAGKVNVNAETIAIDKGGSVSSSSLGVNSSGRTGNVVITANDWLHLSSGAIRIENAANALDAKLASRITPGSIRLTACDIAMDNSEISSRSIGNMEAGSIEIKYAKSLYLDSSFITTESNEGNGGAINIQGGQLIRFQDSGFKTTVHGSTGNGGNINVAADILLMETGLIQANTAASGATGGNITLNLKSLIPSGNMLTIGGTDPIDWRPGIFGLNVIQAAAPGGLSGKIQSSAPRLDLSGELAYLGSPQFDNSAISPDYCALGSGSSLTLTGKGGLMPKGSDWSAY